MQVWELLRFNYAPAARRSSARPNYFMGVISGCSEGASVLSAVRNREASVSRRLVCTKAVVISIRATDFVGCREVVLLSEGPLWEVDCTTILDL